MPGLGGILVQTTPPGYGDPHNYNPAGFTPPQAGAPLIAQNADWRTASAAGAAPTSGAVLLNKIVLPGGQITVTNIVYSISTAGATLTAGQCFVGLYDDQGNLIGTSADQSGTWTGTGRLTTALAGGPFTVYCPFGYVAFVSNGTTNPAFTRTCQLLSGLPSLGVTTGPAMPFAGNVTAQTSLPATVSYASNTVANSQSLWVGIS